MNLLLAMALLVGPDEAAAESYRSRVAAIVEAACAKCHGGAKPKAKISLAGARSADQLAAEEDLWFRVLDQVEAGLMPPPDEPGLAPEKRKELAAWIRGELTDQLAARRAKAGRARLRRLTRAEYANTLHDLFGWRPAVTLHLPDDGRVNGYDKVSAALPLAATATEGYLRMAEGMVERTLRPLPKEGPKTVRAVARESEQSKGHILELPDKTMVSFNTDTTSGPLQGTHTPYPGLYKLRMSVYAYQSDKPLPFGIYAGHVWAYPQMIELVGILEAPPGKPGIVEVEVYLRTQDVNDLAPVSDGLRLIPFGLGVPVPKNTQASACKAPGLAVQWLEMTPPELPLPGDRWLAADFVGPLQDAVRRNEPAAKGKAEPFLAAARASFRRIAPAFLRRDLTAAELSERVAATARRLEAGAGMRDAYLEQVVDLMISPEFLCRIEPPGRLNDFQTATRLSYFLWNSGPDPALLDAARAGKLRSPSGLREQTERLLRDPRSDRFVNDFCGQWLGLRTIGDTSPDSNLYPEYDEWLKVSSLRETHATFRRLLDENRGMKELVAPSWAMLNERLAKHYGIPGVEGAAIRPVDLPAGTPYGGVWTNASVLKVTANGTLTSPVKRGVWVSERLLGIRIPPPPADITPVDPDIRGAKTLREQIALHAGKGACASCHARFDPYGFALESFDVAGGFRTKYRSPRPAGKGWIDGLPVDAAGRTPDGRAFGGIGELRTLVASNPAQLARGLARHLMTYATGAAADRLDDKAVESIVTSTAADGHGMRSLVHALVQSEAFLSK